MKGFVPDLCKHFAACDLPVVQAGGNTTLELTALRRPFIYFPIEGHSEQEIVVARRLRRHRAGAGMSHATCTDTSLAEAILANINRHVQYKDIPFKGACRVVQYINTLIQFLRGGPEIMEGLASYPITEDLL